MMETARRSVIENAMRRPLVIFCALAGLAALAVAAVYYARPDMLPALLAPAGTAAPQAAPASADAAEDKAFYDELEVLATRETAAIVTAYINKRVREKPRLLAVAMDWARDHSVGQQDLQKLNGYYYLLYSDLTFMASQAFKIAGIENEYKDMVRTSFASLLTFDLLMATDALRCKDTSVRDIRGPLVKPRYELLDNAFDYLAPEDIYRLFLTVSKAESAMGSRAPNAELCAGGIVGKTAQLNDPATQHIEVDNPDMPGTKRTILMPPPDFTFTPEYVTDDEWQEARARMQAAVRDSWFQRQMNHKLRENAAPSAVPEQSEPTP